ncbi:MAG: exonuclease SbcCD subunit D [Candidatus Methanomethylophilaceae archaeon]
MRLIHVSDLHIGKKMSETSLAEDQTYILGRIVEAVRDEKADCILIAGDVYDSSQPSAESMRILDDFLTDLSETGVRTFMISGNHDSPERIDYGGSIFERNGIHVAGVFDGKVEPVTVEDGDGITADICMLPFVKPHTVRRFFPDAEIDDYTSAVRTVIGSIPRTDSRYRVIMAHQFVSSGSGSPERCDSEDIPIGGLDDVDVSVFDGFDYVALGHLHRPQSVGRPTVRYCGTPLKYSKSECGVPKSITVVELGDGIGIRTIPLTPLRDVRKVRGTLDQIIEAGKDDPSPMDFIYAEITDDPIDAMSRLREVYPNTLNLTFVRDAGRDVAPVPIPEAERLDLMDMFRRMFLEMKDTELSEDQEAAVRSLMEESGVIG